MSSQEIRDLLDEVLKSPQREDEVIRLCDERDVDCGDTDAYLDICKEACERFP